MSLSVTGVFRAINELSKPLQKKVMKKLGLSMEGKPGRTSKTAGINVGKERVAIKEKLDRYRGRLETAGVGAAGFAAYSASDFINDLLGIKKAGKGSQFTKEELARFRQKKAAASETKATKKPTPKLTKDDMPKPRPKDLGKKKMFMKERSGKDSKVEFEALKGSIGLNASKKDLKPVPAGKKGKGLSMLPTSVRNNMGFMYGGGMPMPSKKPRMSNTDYRKASKGMLIISIDMKKKKKGKGKKA